ncbi:MAG: nucleoside monophosphate kinase [Bryobacterales bacterium]
MLCVAFATLLPALASAQQAQAPVIVLIGPPGSGKSTQAARIQKQYRLAVITREQLMQDDPALLARYKQPEIQGVEPRSDPALNKLFVRRLEQTDISNGLLIDGYPATKDHADFLRDVIVQKGLATPIVLQLDVPDDVVRKRLEGQTAEKIEQDLKDYHREMDFISAYFPEADIVHIDGAKKPNGVFKQIRQVLKQRLNKK